jgi:hypothetical protein
LVLQAEPGAPEPYERARRALPAAEGKVAEIEGQFVEHAIAEDKASPAALRVLRLEIGG